MAARTMAKTKFNPDPADLLFQAERVETLALALESLRCSEWGFNTTLSDEEEDQRLEDLQRMLGSQVANEARELRRKIEILAKAAA